MDGIGQTRLASVVSLFASGSTLVCCALPALLVALGAGAALSSVIAAFPQLVWLSEYKVAIFSFAGAMLLLAGYMQWRARGLSCPIDPALAAVCTRTRRVSMGMFLVSLAIYLIGGFFAFIAPVLTG
jgi:hypothetical protein